MTQLQQSVYKEQLQKHFITADGRVYESDLQIYVLL